MGGLKALSDKSLVCRECGSEFVFSEGKQESYQKLGLLNEPSRCPDYHSTRRRTSDEESGAHHNTCGNLCLMVFCSLEVVRRVSFWNT